MAKLSGSTMTVAELQEVLKNQGLDPALYAKAATAMDITLVDGEAEALDPTIAQANADRNAGLGDYGMTAAMKAEQKMMHSPHNIWDE